MAFSRITTQNPIFLRLNISGIRSSPVIPSNSISFPSSSSSYRNINRLNRLSVRSASVPVALTAIEGLKPAITLSDNALNHLSKMRSERGQNLYLRIGVKQGGCSGMSYTMDFENKDIARTDDSTIEYEGFTIVCDPKSMLFLFGMQLDYCDALIGGGFSFKNPNASQTCGCGKSFAAEM